MATGLEHERTAQVVRVFGRPLSLGEHRSAARRWKTIDNQTQRFARYMRVDGLDDHERLLRFS
jgi:hypothetical protein